MDETNRDQITAVKKELSQEIKKAADPNQIDVESKHAAGDSVFVGRVAEAETEMKDLTERLVAEMKAVNGRLE